MRFCIVNECQLGLPCLHRRGQHDAIELHERNAAADAERILDCDLIACTAVLEHNLEAWPACRDAW
jgi:hypothetical protein